MQRSMEQAHNPRHKWIAPVLLVVALLGFFDASYLTIEHYRGVVVPCSIGGCETVLTSKYAVVAGVPLSVLGMGYYLSLLILLAVYLTHRREHLLKIAKYLMAVGFLVSLGLVYLQIFVIGAICLYCMGSALSSTILFILSRFAR